MAPDLTKLTHDLREAIAAGQQAASGLPDEGTCNFDSLFISTGKGRQFGRKSKKLEAAIERSGASCFHTGSGWRKGYVISIGVPAQGYPRTKGHETARKLLESRGWQVSMWYQMD